MWHIVEKITIDFLEWSPDSRSEEEDHGKLTYEGNKT